MTDKLLWFALGVGVGMVLWEAAWQWLNRAMAKQKAREGGGG